VCSDRTWSEFLRRLDAIREQQNYCVLYKSSSMACRDERKKERGGRRSKEGKRRQRWTQTRLGCQLTAGGSLWMFRVNTHRSISCHIHMMLQLSEGMQLSPRKTGFPKCRANLNAVQEVLVHTTRVTHATRGTHNTGHTHRSGDQIRWTVTYVGHTFWRIKHSGWRDPLPFSRWHEKYKYIYIFDFGAQSKLN